MRLPRMQQVQALEEARERTLAIVAPLADEDVERVHDPIMSPLAWDLAHIAAYEDLWIGHRLGGLPLLQPDLAAMYDAFETPRAIRGSLPLLDRAGALDYLEAVRERTLAVLDSGAGDNGGGALVELVLRHEHQHDETMLQTLQLACLGTAPDVPRHPLPASATPATGLERVDVPAGPCTLGAPDDGFAYDNERPRHRVDVPAFAIGRVPVTNGDYLEFVEGGGYRRREWWSAAGWAWKQQHGVGHPGGWTRTAGAWLQQCMDGTVPLPLDAPVVHVSWFEADAFARAHGARLPTEAEWEKAACWDADAGAARPFPWGEEPPAVAGAGAHANLDHGALRPAPAGAFAAGASPCGALGMLGDVWEWTASDFGGYPGFRAYPYREYSEVFFGERYKVLRGGSWATRARVATPTFRNWDLPQRRQIFAGFRLAFDPRRGGAA